MTDTSILAVYEYGFLVFAALWGWVLWSTVLGLSEVIGITFIIVAGIIIITRSARNLLIQFRLGSMVTKTCVG